MYIRTVIISAMLASGAAAAPVDTMNPMHLPNAGGYMQPGNPNRGISAAGPENALVRQERKACAKRDRDATRCTVVPRPAAKQRHARRG